MLYHTSHLVSCDILANCYKYMSHIAHSAEVIITNKYSAVSWDIPTLLLINIYILHLHIFNVELCKIIN